MASKPGGIPRKRPPTKDKNAGLEKDGAPARRTRRAPVSAALSTVVTRDQLEAAKPARGATRQMRVDDLRPSPHQPRRHMDAAALESLAASIKAQGVLQPLLVRETPRGPEIVAGERRWRAATLAGLQTVPVEVRELSDEQVAVAAAVENLQREDLSVIDEVDATVTIIGHRLGLTRAQVPGVLNALQYKPESNPGQVQELEELFRELGGSWLSFTKNRLRILGWPEPVLNAIREHQLGYSLAGIVAAAPQEHRAALLEMALGGASQARLRTELTRLKSSTFQKVDAFARVEKMSKTLGNRRRFEALDPQKRQRLEQLMREIDELYHL
ncbi:ParB/RepB/Spo0J family partition protein [Deinococcus peraridilitoris]|uniref:ParB-like partition protein n=1 Tax=Deinococcus peraridilitoris (strain DSM 19664 / LMG 22246 / CIP 109416 / KR-200) TaxID=937777 RepID=L0A5U5_DEIPD|nr:ParB/RepB/Spo0J family partition protein [Deinococcus peraridilitoris]AFZ69253.1 ParB-like partition protein [Deinococcus peraridilitoris DSM 19664]